MAGRTDDAGPRPFVGPPTLAYHPDEVRSGGTVEVTNEDHTFGNSIRYVLMRNREVTFCGYSIPHPSENRMNIRVQTTGRPADEVFRDGLTTLEGMCQIVLDKFSAALEKHEAGQAMQP